MQTRTSVLTVLAMGSLLCAHGSVWGQVPDVPPAPPAAPLDTTVPTPTPITVLLRYKYKKGQVLRYKIIYNRDDKMSTQSMPAKIHIELILRTTVLNIRASDGAATIKSEVEDVKSSLNGQDVPMNPSVTFAMKAGLTMLFLPNGKYPKDSLAKMMPQVPEMHMGYWGSIDSNIYLPDGPVKIGDVWKTNSKWPGSVVNLQEKLLKINLLAGKTSADIKQTLNVNEVSANEDMGMPTEGKGLKDTSEMRLTGLTNFDVDLGLVARSSTNIKVSSKSHMTRMELPSSVSDWKKFKLLSHSTSIQYNGTVQTTLELIDHTP